MMCVHLVIVSSDNMDVWRDGPEVLVRLAVTEIACAQDLLNLAGHQKFLELCGKIVDPVRDVQVADDEDEDHLGWAIANGMRGVVGDEVAG